MHKYTHVDALYQVIRYINNVNKSEEVPDKFKIKSPVIFRGSVKLHGTNSGVSQFKNELIAQSRTRIITSDDDNHGFAKFVEDKSDVINEIIDNIRGKNEIKESEKVILFGEWIGPGLQKGVAINNLPSKQWALFAVKVFDGEEGRYLDAVLKFGDQYKEHNIFSIMDAPTWSIQIDFDSEKDKEESVAYLDKVTSEVEACCPWGQRFGIEGVGEGIVWTPIGKHWGNSDLFFKTKGEKHKNVKSKKNTEQLEPELLKSINEFVEFAVTENRLNQGMGSVREAEHDLSMKSIGSFLKWVGQDVKRECAAELETNGLDWNNVQKQVTQKAKDFFIKEMKKI
jgi:hypothetical protein